MISFDHGETVEWLAYAGATRNAHGQMIPEYADPAPVDGVGIDVPDVAEPRDGAGQRQITDYVLFLPAGFRCDRRDQFMIDGELYGVEGRARPVRSPFTGSTFPTPVKVRRIDG
jgi:hypothetical protein